MAFFDEPLVLSLKAKLPEMAKTDRQERARLSGSGKF